MSAAAGSLGRVEGGLLEVLRAPWRRWGRREDVGWEDRTRRRVRRNIGMVGDALRELVVLADSGVNVVLISRRA